VKPELVVSVHHAGLTREGNLRHPVFRGVREDIEPRACTLAAQEEIADQLLEQAEAEHRESPSQKRGRVVLSNQDKVYWPEEGYTKGDMCRYYDAIADTLLPYLQNRPVLMVRYPDGIEGKSFYQWSPAAGTPDWIRTFTVRGGTEERERETTSYMVSDRDTLLYLANLGCIPLHVLASRADDLDRCDFATIDFDLGGAPLAIAIELAQSLHGLLDDLGLPSFPKTSGQSGLHVLIPLGGAPFAAAKALSELLGHVIQRRHPTLCTMERKRDKRPAGVVYVDTGQVGQSRSIVAPYSVRAVRGAGVSTPLTWDEVSLNLDPSRFTMFTVPDRVTRVGDPMATMLSETPDLGRAVAQLGELVKRQRGA
jgi:bifunctional non-homologous end joining protein LigD